VRFLSTDASEPHSAGEQSLGSDCGERSRCGERHLAVAMIASYEGIALLTNTFRDSEPMTREGRRLERWIDSLA
jgi:hypothetical protein